MSTLLRFSLAFAAAAVSIYAQGPQKVSMGSYECWANGSARLLLNFSIRSATAYTGSDNKPGRYSYDQKSGQITFQDGVLAGSMPTGFIAVYHEPRGLPTVSFRSPRGAEAAFCERAK